MAFELVSYETLKALIGLTKDAITDYPALGVIQLSVEAAIDEYLGRGLEKKDRTETIYIGRTPSKMVSLVGLPVLTVTSVTITQWNTDTVLTSADYIITDYGLELHGKYQNAKIVVVYNGGYESAGVPAGITRAALMQTVYEWQAKDQIGAESVSTEGGMVQRPALGLLKETKRMLDSYKHPLRQM